MRPSPSPPAPLRDPDALLRQLPVAVAVTAGPEHRFTLASQRFTALVGREVEGRSLREALPELAAHGLLALLDRVHATGEPGASAAVHARYDRDGDGALEDAWLDLTCHPLRGPDGRTEGTVTVLHEVTAQVLARRDVEMLAAQLKESEARFRTVVEALPQLVWTARPDGHHEFFNQRWYDYTGLQPGDTDGEGWAGVFHADDIGEAQRRWHHSLATGEPYDVEYRCRRHDGVWRWMLGRALPIHDTQGRITRWLGTCTDIHEAKRAEDGAKQAEAAARESEAKFRGLAESLPQLVWTAEGASRPDYFNRRWEQLLGLAPESLATEGWMHVLHPEDAQRTVDAWRAAAAAGTPFEAELRLRSKDGTYRWYLARAMPERGADGHVRKWYATTTDVDAQRRAGETQRFLAEAGKELVASLDVAATLKRLVKLAVPVLADWCAVDLLRPDGSVERVEVAHPDPAMVAYAHELHRRYPPDLSAPHGLPRVLRTGESERMEDIPDALLVQAAVDAEHLRIARALGLKSYVVAPIKSATRVLGALTLVNAESGRRFGPEDQRVAEELALRAGLALENARLVEEVRALNQDLERRVQERTAELREANAELESFSYSVSHDLRAPLRHITGFAQLLDKRAGAALDPAAREYVHTIAEAAQQGSKLVDDLLAFSRMGRAALRPGRVALDELLADVRRELAPDAAGRRVTWEVRPQPLPHVWADPALLRLALHNLLSNALKYTRPRDEAVITLSAEAQGGEVELRVQDNGVGFDMRHADKLFGVFQRLHGADAFEGTGIGLANVRRIVTRHGGRVWAEAQVGQGATFHLTLPARGGG